MKLRPNGRGKTRGNTKKTKTIKESSKYNAM